MPYALLACHFLQTIPSNFFHTFQVLRLQLDYSESIQETRRPQTGTDTVRGTGGVFLHSGILASAVIITAVGLMVYLKRAKLWCSFISSKKILTYGVEYNRMFYPHLKWKPASHLIINRGRKLWWNDEHLKNCGGDFWRILFTCFL